MTLDRAVLPERARRHAARPLERQHLGHCAHGELGPNRRFASITWMAADANDINALHGRSAAAHAKLPASQKLIPSVAAVPCFPPKSMSLPHEIARAAANTLGVPDISSRLAKIRVTNAAKTNPGLHPDAHEVRGRLDGRHVLVVDDLYHTGSTLESVATKLRAAGADHLVGLCVTRVHQGMSS
jgi:hypothetical protein